MTIDKLIQSVCDNLGFTYCYITATIDGRTYNDVTVEMETVSSKKYPRLAMLFNATESENDDDSTFTQLRERKILCYLYDKIGDCSLSKKAIVCDTQIDNAYSLKNEIKKYVDNVSFGKNPSRYMALSDNNDAGCVFELIIKYDQCLISSMESL